MLTHDLVKLGLSFHRRSILSVLHSVDLIGDGQSGREAWWKTLSEPVNQLQVFKNQNLDRSSAIWNEHILLIRYFCSFFLYHCLCLTPRLICIFYIQLEESHKIAFCVQFPYWICCRKLVTSKCSLLSVCVINCPIIRMEYPIPVIWMNMSWEISIYLCLVGIKNIQYDFPAWGPPLGWPLPPQLAEGSSLDLAGN